MPTIQFDLDSTHFLDELQGVGTVSSGVASYGDAAAYALVWEFGNARQTRKGPKTTLGINLLTGEQVWLTIQAPTGYVRVNEDKYWEIIGKHLGSMTLSSTTKEGIRKELETAAYGAAKEIAEIIRQTAPIDTGALRASILALPPGDEMLEDEGLFEGQVLDIVPSETE